ncbi:MAG: glycoside hydrolase family 57 protein [Gammaproteobacteria bacterium]|nr:glycoside hydrolase family 57 protein [Gammaproteobacteria bacterium]MCF6363438.1 glycoside hydrolase family 57 protein [Gammaproteobacteria bacterium]
MSDENPSKTSTLNVVLFWHMHQPQYCDRPNGEYQLPWTYLHAIKDYTDMAAHLEAEPQARAVVNFAPTLLEQLDDYARQVEGFLSDGQRIRDPLLAALANPVLPTDAGERLELLGQCLRANEKTLISRYVPYSRLADMARCFLDHPESGIYISEQFLIDLLMWYHLAWLGETVRRENQRVQMLIEKGCDFSLRDRRALMEIIGELLSGVIGRYRRLAEQGRVELSVTPYAHPIVPLVLDLESAREAMPDVQLPLLGKYPGGEERVRWHIREGIKTFEHYFGFRPTGCWPAEGSVSTESIPFYQEAGFRWIASGENVLRNSLAQAKSDLPEDENHVLHRAYTVADNDVTCFFRDDGLSDLIGFNFSDWHADDAVGNLLAHLNNIADTCEDRPGAVVSIILDGENAWEYYPENGYYFLEALYRGLANHPRLNLTTYAEILQDDPPTANISRLVAGSWVYGTFSTWIGDADKNRAWDMLGDAKHCFDKVIASGRLSDEQRQTAERQLAICEGSDWFWWFGDYNPAEAVRDFERLFRSQLSALYFLLGEELPEYLSHVFARGGGQPQTGGVMRRGSDH